MAPRASQADGRVSGTRAEDRQGRWRQMVSRRLGRVSSTLRSTAGRCMKPADGGGGRES
ncbi:hypothetical protein VDGL01_02797 [Verticillium dahliae]